MTPEDASEPAEKPKTPPSTAGMTTKVVKGSLWTLAGQVAPLAVSLVATPFVIRLLGAESYGVLILIGLIPTYLGFADFGMSMASTKFGSEAYAEGDEEKEARIVRTAALIALMTSVPVAAALIIFASPVIALFNVPEALQAEAATALRIAALTFVINFLCGIFNTPQLARLRMDLNTFINAGSRILGLIATPIVLYLGYGIIGAVTVLLAASLLNLLGHLMISRTLVKTLIGETIESPAVRPLLKFGGPLVVSLIAGFALVHGEKGVLAATVSSTALAHYSVAFTLASMTTLFSGAMIQSLIPAFSQMQAPEKREELQQLYSRLVRLLIIFSPLMMGTLALIAEDFFRLWAGEEFGRESTGPLLTLLVGLAFNLVAYMPHALLLSAGKTDVLAKVYWIQLPPFLVSVWFLSAWYGAVGAALAWSLRVGIDALVQFILARRFTGLWFAIPNWWALLIAIVVIFLPAVLKYISLIETTYLFLIAVLSFGTYALIVKSFLVHDDEYSWLVMQIRKRLA
ncbi:MAG: oligosaccharide flippase family protein [Acidobacteria bacterium]|nr:oligosaccharide flippase family protein [Acidobacteriota bacterium]